MTGGSMIGRLVWRGFGLVYGFFNLLIFVSVAAIRDGAFFKRSSAEQKRELAAAQDKYWNLQKDPLPGFKHRFATLSNGCKIHYVVNVEVDAGASPGKNVAIFIHGFPDSFLLWRNLLTSPALESHILIALDLPGYGGSGDLPNYGAEELLEGVTEFIIDVRQQFLKENAKVVVIGHDWGGVITARLASEANQLADRWVIASAIIPQHAHANALTKAASASQMLRTYIRRPWKNLSLVKNAFSTLTPVLSQIGRSFYVFIFNLPYPFSTFFATFGNYWFLKTLHNVAAGLLQPNGQWIRKLNTKELSEFLAESAGPGIGQFEDSSEVYAEAVEKRTWDIGMSEKIRIYREGLFMDSWEKSLKAIVKLSEIPVSKSHHGSRSSGAGLFDDGPPGALKAPATLVYGKEDLGFDRHLGLEGIGDYMTKGSQVLLLEGAGHWLPFEQFGSKVLNSVVEWAMGEEERPLQEKFERAKEVTFLVDK